MKIKIKSTIWYRVDKDHPDITPDDVKNGILDETLEFTDVYYIDPDYFYGDDHINSYIRHDLALVAGGGYDTDHIHDVKYKLTRGDIVWE